MGWAGSQIHPSRRHVAMPRRWAWLAFEPDDLAPREIKGQSVMVAHHCRLAYSRIRDGRIEHGETMRVTVQELWAAVHWWVPSRGGLWMWTGQPRLAPRGVGLDTAAPEDWGWKRGATRFGDDALHVVWQRLKSRVTLASVQGMIRDWERDGRPWIDAVRDDVLAWAMVVEHEGLGHLRASVGAQAWEAYRARWCDSSMWAGGSEPHRALAREAIAGGIAHVIQRGALPGQWWEIDMSRCYRTVMRDEYLPCRSVSRLRRATMDILRKAVERDCVIAAVTMSDRGFIAAERDEYGRLHWSSGAGYAVLTTPDLIDALEAEAITAVHELCTWTRGRPLRALGQGLEDLESRIPASDPGIIKRQIKLLANAVYGRLAMRDRRWRKHTRVDDTDLDVWSYWDMDGKRYERYRQIGYDVERESQPAEHRWGHAAAAAHIAAYGRARLRRMMDCAGYVNVAYVDTDGVIVNEDGMIRLQESGLWDALNLRIAYTGDVEIRGVRDYSIAGKTVRSGVKEGKVK